MKLEGVASVPAGRNGPVDTVLAAVVIALLGFGGLWLGVFAWQLAKRPLVPINDPQFESVMATDVHR